MLAYILAIAVALSSVILFFSAFFAPKLHRKDDFLWSGVGLFYGLILWVCAGRMTGGVLLGQIAAVLLVLSFAWQTISLRSAIANPDKLSGIKTFSLLDWIGGGLGKKKAKIQPQTSVAVKPEPIIETVESPEPVSEMIEGTIIDSVIPTETTDISAPPEVDERDEDVTVSMEDSDEENLVADKPMETLAEKQTEPTISPVVQPNKTQGSPKVKKQGFFSKLFGKKPSPTQPESITTALNAIETVESNDENSEEPNESLENPPSIEADQVNQVIVKTIELEFFEEETVEADTHQTKITVETTITEQSITVSSLPEESTEDDLEDDWGDEDEDDLEAFEKTTDDSEPTIIEAIAVNEVIINSPLEKTSEDENVNTSPEETSYKFASYIEENPVESSLLEENLELINSLDQPKEAEVADESTVLPIDSPNLDEEKNA